MSISVGLFNRDLVMTSTKMVKKMQNLKKMYGVK